MSVDPFDEPADEDRTVIRPRPGGAGRDRRPSAASAASSDGNSVPKTGTNQLVAAASGIIAAAIRIESDRGRMPDLDRLRGALVEAIQTFETEAMASGLELRSLRAARYALCAMVDDIVLSTPEGTASSWTRQSMTSIFHDEVVGGERFFEILDQMQKDLGHHEPVVELMYLCMSLGFIGRYRVRPRGVAELTELRDGVYKTIRSRRGDFERELSPQWRGINAGARSLARRVPLWAVGLGTVAIAATMYLGFTFMLASVSETAFAELFALPPHGQIAIPRQTRVSPSVPAVAPAAAVVEVSKLKQFLEPEIKAGLVQVFEDAQSVTVRLTNRNMFASGTAVLATPFAPLLARIGDALNDETGNVNVYGFTDNQPIRTARFPSNFELSQARADAVADHLRARVKDPKRLRTQGKGQADPIASNATPEGRQENRRTEIVLVRGTGSS
ncbi:MAG: type VI secretion system protein TssL, long form [Acetobacteraceae bacterium]|jgi:type VI secretion system protein ImpK